MVGVGLIYCCTGFAGLLTTYSFVTDSGPGRQYFMVGQYITISQKSSVRI